MAFQRGMWTEAWIQSVVARKFVALAVFGELVIQLSMEWFAITRSVGALSAATFVSTLLWAYLAYAIHAQILLPRDRISTMSSASVFGFALRSFGIFIVIAVAVVLVALILTKMIGVGLPGANELYLMLAAITLGFPMFVWLGTVLPAYVAGRARGVNAAIGRGRSQFGWIAGRLLIGPGLLLVLSGALYSLLPIPIYDNSSFWNKEWIFQPIAVLGFLLYYTVQAFVTALTAVILSRAYIRAEGMPDTAAA